MGFIFAYSIWLEKNPPRVSEKYLGVWGKAPIQIEFFVDKSIFFALIHKKCLLTIGFIHIGLHYIYARELMRKIARELMR